MAKPVKHKRVKPPKPEPVHRGPRREHKPFVATLRDVAKATDLTIPTVSRILSGKDRCPPATRQRVMDAAKRLNYRRNLLIASIQSGRTRTIGVMLYVANEFFGRIALGIHDELIAEDYIPMFLWPTPGPTATDRSNELEQIHRLVDRRVDAVILCTREDTIPEGYLHEIRDRGMPLITVDHELQHVKTDFVGTDDTQGGQIAAEHLLGLGHRRVGVITGPSAVTLAGRRCEAFQAQMSRVSGTSVSTYEEPTLVDGQAGARALLVKHPRPTAIFTVTDHLAVGVYDVARKLGLSIPDQLSVVSFGNLEKAGILQPGLTTLEQFPEQIGKLAARQALDRLNGGEAGVFPKKIRLKPEIVLRGSTAMLSTSFDGVISS